jgi:hypothetical protein
VILVRIFVIPDRTSVIPDGMFVILLDLFDFWWIGSIL